MKAEQFDFEYYEPKDLSDTLWEYLKGVQHAAYGSHAVAENMDIFRRDENTRLLVAQNSNTSDGLVHIGGVALLRIHSDVNKIRGDRGGISNTTLRRSLAEVDPSIQRAVEVVDIFVSPQDKRKGLGSDILEVAERAVVKRELQKRERVIMFGAERASRMREGGDQLAQRRGGMLTKIKNSSTPGFTNVYTKVLHNR